MSAADVLSEVVTLSGGLEGVVIAVFGVGVVLAVAEFLVRGVRGR